MNEWILLTITKIDRWFSELIVELKLYGITPGIYDSIIYVTIIELFVRIYVI